MRHLLLLALGLMLWSSGARAADYVVHVALSDGRAVTHRKIRKTEKFLRKANPDLELKPIRYDLDAMGIDDVVLDKVRKRLSEIPTENGQRIRLLVIDTPDELDLIEPLRGKLTSYARVVVLGQKSKVPPAERLSALDVPDGSVFELTTEPRRFVRAGVGRTRLKVLGFASVGLGAVAAGLAAMGNEYDAMIPTFFSASLIPLVTSTMAVVLFDQIRPWIGVLRRRLDYGRVTQLKDGEVRSEVPMRAARRRLVFSCEDRLSR